MTRPDYRRPYRPYRQPTRTRETIARLAFGIIAALVLGAYFVALLYAPEIAAALAAWHH